MQLYMGMSATLLVYDTGALERVDGRSLVRPLRPCARAKSAAICQLEFGISRHPYSLQNLSEAAIVTKCNEERRVS